MARFAAALLLITTLFPVQQTQSLKLVSTKLPQCPVNGKIKSFQRKVALAKKMKKSSKPKRFVGEFPFDCLHVSVIQDEQGAWQWHMDIHECCGTCQVDFYACMVVYNQHIICSSLAHTCACQCRSQFVVKAYRKKRKLGVCKKKVCRRLRRCCLENLCIPLFSHKYSVSKIKGD